MVSVSVRALAVGAASLLLIAHPDAVAAAERGPTRHSSDGLVGPLLSEVADSAQLRARGAIPGPAPEQTWAVGPGVGYREWTVALAQGDVRMHLLRADLDVLGVSLDLVSGRRVTDRAPFSQLVSAAGARGGVNADFFDIDDTGAPLGVGRSRARGLLHGPRTGWNSTLTIGADGTPRVGTTSVTGAVRRAGRVVVRVDGLNDPLLTGHEVGVYTAAWGTAPGRRVADGARMVRQVVVRGGRVRSTTRRPVAKGAIAGTVLVGRGKGATALGRLRVGQRVRVVTRAGQPGDRVVVGGSVPLLQGGAYATSDHRELHPRTAFGYDRDTREVLLLVADGRTEVSKGLTLRQLARQLKELGAEDALNLDGGGSSTLVAPDATGTVGVRNQPSAGRERAVPNGLALRWAPGTGR